MVSRRKFIGIAMTLTAACGLGFLFYRSGLKSKKRILAVKADKNEAYGHLLRDGINKVPDTMIETDVVIAGGGVSGLTAGMTLSKHGQNNFVLLELAEMTGGNSSGGKNNVSAFPWGAHYLPLPNLNQKDMLEFLFESGVISAYDDNGLPVYNEEHLCFEPEERLFMQGAWHKGLLPENVLPAEDEADLKAFTEKMQYFKSAKGKDGKEAFTIPVEMCSLDSEFTKFDNISMSEFLKQNNWNSEFLNWYVNYCCLDDFGMEADQTSAWAGIHYFASRKGVAANAEQHQMLCWPEGNYKLASDLRNLCRGKIETGILVYGISEENNKINVDTLNTRTNTFERYICKQLVMATPQYVNKRILPGGIRQENSFYKSFHYFPWMVANISIDNNEFDKDGTQVCWDNVIYKSPSLGYVNACHQSTDLRQSGLVLTYYLPIGGRQASQSRQQAYDKTAADWTALIINDLKQAHPGIENCITDIVYKVWGHGMSGPVKGFIFGDERKKAAQSYKGRIHFAHSDLSGISIFEEGFFQGNRAALEVLKKL